MNYIVDIGLVLGMVGFGLTEALLVFMIFYIAFDYICENRRLNRASKSNHSYITELDNDQMEYRETANKRFDAIHKDYMQAMDKISLMNDKIKELSK